MFVQTIIYFDIGSGVPPFGKELFTRLGVNVCSQCDMSIWSIVISHFCFEGRILVLIVPVSVHYLSFICHNLKILVTYNVKASIIFF